MNQKKVVIWKCGLVMINIVMAIILGISMIASLLLYQAGGRTMSVFVNRTSYLKSEGLKNSMSEEAYMISSYAGYRDDFETDGKFDENKAIDVMEYLDGSETRGVSYKPLKYRLGDLLSWASNQNYISETDAMEYATEEDNTQTEDVYDQNGNIIGSKTTVIYGNGNNGVVNQIHLTELYAPMEYTDVESYATQNDLNVDMCYTALSQAIEMISGDIDSYYEFADRYNPDNTNIRYVVENRKTGASYSNGDLKTLSKNSATTKMAIHDYDVQVALDTSFPVDDNFSKSNTYYSKYVKYSGLMMAGIILGFFGFILSLGGITALAGRKGDKLEQLYGIDKIPTEIAAAIWCGLGGFIIVCMNAFAAEYLGRFLLYVIIGEGSLLLLLNAIFLCAYCSLVRRIKAGTIISNSICGRIFRGMKMILRHMSIVRKTLLLFVGYCFINIFILFFFFFFGWGYDVNGYVVMGYVLFNLAVLVGLCRHAIERNRLVEGVNRIAGGDIEAKLDEEQYSHSNKELAISINNIGNGLQKAVEDSTKNERTKSDLITNVSHDIKTPLTSIINYVGLLKMENIQDEKIKGYIDVLDKKSQRLKHLTEDLVEASKISSGNIELNMISLDFHELLQQTVGEFEEKFQERNLDLVVNQPAEPVVINADGKHMWRILENLFGNVYKYAMPGTRVYVDLTQNDGKMTFSVRNISESSLNISAEELTERFIQGDISRSTEGSGLGLSIAKNLTTLQNGTFDIYLDGDLFKVTIMF